MLNLSLNIEPVLTDIDFYDRIKVAAELGFSAIEFWDSEVKDVKKLGRIARESNVKVAMCTINGIFKYVLDQPYPLLLKAVNQTIDLMKEMDCGSMIIFSGNAEGKSDSQKNIIIENLKRLAEVAEKEDVMINIEPLNSIVECKGHYLDSQYKGFEIIKCVNSPFIKMVYDVYHIQVMEGNIIDSIKRNIDSISHFHSAGVPGRNELFLGENDYCNIMKAAEDAGYSGYFGVEYWPSYEDHMKSLKEVLQYLRK